jgi:hypothetical protein
MRKSDCLALCQFLLACFSFSEALAISTPTGFVNRIGDQSIVLHWDKLADPTLSGYRVYRALSSGGPFTQIGGLLTVPGYCDLFVNNGQTYYYQLTAVATNSQESPPTPAIALQPHAFASDDDFLEYVQQTSFDYFWYGANPANGLVPDRTAAGSPCSIAAVGFGLSAIAIAVDHGWISRTQAVARIQTTLNTFALGPQGPAASGTIGYNGWYYHFLDMTTGVRAPNSELSSIDTALLLGGVLHVKQYFDGTTADETNIRATADALFNRVDWNWMARGTNAVCMGWFPNSGFLSGDWIGYNEGMLIYCLGLGATNPLPPSAWNRWTSGYTWGTYYGQTFIPFSPMFGHQYSHCWIDFRHIADSFMNAHNSTYFENSRRATLAQQTYAILNPGHFVAYTNTVWGLTACDGPNGYTVHGIPPGGADDGTIAPTASGGSIAFAPEISVPTLRYFYSHYRPRIWTAYGYRDAFNIGAQWYATDELGIDQGPIVVMIENYRTQRVWQLFMRNPEVQRGLQRAGFAPLPFAAAQLQPSAAQNTMTLSWDATPGITYQVEYSPNLTAWFSSPTGEILATNSVATWTDTGPPGTSALPFNVPKRYYRVFQFGSPQPSPGTLAGGLSSSTALNP